MVRLLPHRKVALALTILVFLGLVCFPVLLVPRLSAADMYRYVDEKGVENITDSLESIPEKLRDKASKIEEDGIPEAIASFPKTAKEKLEEKKLPNRLKRFVKSRQGLAILSAAMALIVVVMLLKLVRRRAVKYITVFLALCFLSLVLIFIFKPREFKKSMKVISKEQKKGLDRIIKEKF